MFDLCSNVNAFLYSNEGSPREPPHIAAYATTPIRGGAGLVKGLTTISACRPKGISARSRF